MSDPDAYVMLLSSLPQPGAIFRTTQTPLSRLKLDSRLRVLTPDHAATLKRIEDALRWDHLPIELSEQDIIRRGRTALSDADGEALRLIVRDRLELPTCIAALRRRRRAHPAPSGHNPWGLGRWTGHIARHWTEPAFGLENVFPWLPEADRRLREGDSNGLERLLLEEACIKLGRIGGSRGFDFEAVVVYVLKWNIIDRWSRYNAEGATKRFRDLTDAALGSHPALSFEGDN